MSLGDSFYQNKLGYKYNIRWIVVQDARSSDQNPEPLFAVLAAKNRRAPFMILTANECLAVSIRPVVARLVKRKNRDLVCSSVLNSTKNETNCLTVNS